AGRGDVEEGQLVGALGVVPGGQLHRVPRVPEVGEVDALDHSPGVHVQARDHPHRDAHSARSSDRASGADAGRPALVAPRSPGGRPDPLTAARASGSVKAPAYRALPTMQPSTPSGASAANARRSSSDETPPPAMIGALVAAHSRR